LKKAIEDGKYVSGTHIPHTYDLIKLYKVSLTTIVRAVKLLEKEGLVKRIKSKGTFVLDKGIKEFFHLKKAEKVGLLFRGYLSSMMAAHFFVHAYQGMENALKKFNKSIIPLGTEGKPEEQYLEEIKNAGISGAVCYSMYEESIRKGLKAMNIPLVYCDFIDYNLPADQVTMDHLKAGSITLHKLYDLGHRRIIFFGNYKKTKRHNDPDHEYWRLACEAEAGFLHLKHFYSYFISFEGGLEEMKRKMKKILEKHTDCTGFICASTTYYELLKSLIEENPQLEAVERDVVLFSDWPEKKHIQDRIVYQCRWDTQEMGKKAAEILMEKLKGGPHRPMIHYVPVQIE
jgi:DNA-binding LacI/PurR family transcriptional regulator